jgi:hypothetical protein
MLKNSVRGYPFLSFKIVDNPYFTKERFLMNMYIPLKISVRNNNKIKDFEIFKNIDRLNNDVISKVENLIHKYSVNNQTLSIDKNSYKLIYSEPVLIDEYDIHQTVLLPDHKQVKKFNQISPHDIYIPLYMDTYNGYINKPIWKKYN